ncbi:MAG TPA: hypothetical protein PKI33_13905, partial [Anaerolineales bacterium]|nr:hypothetical protein [Anaerolineales bacterium]
FMVHPILVNMGELAYGIYILHIPVKWLFEWALTSAGITNVEVVMYWAFLPLILSIAFIVHFYLDTPFRKWLKTFLKNISLRILTLDFILILLLAYFMFPARFGDGREYRSYQEMERLVLWLAFFIRPAMALLFGTYRHEIVSKQGNQWLISITLSALIGSLLIAVSVYIGYFTGWFENFPRSIFVIDWGIYTVFSILIRFAFRKLGVYKQEIEIMPL